MPVFHIYRNGEKIVSEEFDSLFNILETDDPNERADWIGNTLKSLDGREIVAWIWKVSKDPKFFGFSGFVHEPCELILDNTPLPNATDEESIDFTGKEARFLLHDYEFVCQFPPLEERDQST